MTTNTETDPMVRHAEAAIAAAEGRPPPADDADPYAHYTALALAEDQAEAKQHGVTVDQLRGSREHGMLPEEFAAYGSGAVRSPADALRIEAEAEAQAEARAEAERLELVDQERRRLP